MALPKKAAAKQVAKGKNDQTSKQSANGIGAAQPFAKAKGKPKK